MVFTGELATFGRHSFGSSFASQAREALARSKKNEILQQRPTVLVVQSRNNAERLKGEQERVRALAAKAGVDVWFVNPLTQHDRQWEDTSKLLQGVDGVLFTGSSDVDLSVRTAERDLYLFRTSALAKEAVRRGSALMNPLPVLGICLGHQMIHLVSGGKVERDPAQAETGTGRVVLKGDAARDRFLVNVPLTHDAQRQFGFLEIFGHKDSVTKLGKGFRRLGSTERNKNSLARRRGVFTTQGHPEITDASALRRAMELAKGHDSRMGDYVENYPILDTPGTDEIVTNFFRSVFQRVERRKDKVARRR